MLILPFIPFSGRSWAFFLCSLAIGHHCISDCLVIWSRTISQRWQCITISDCLVIWLKTISQRGQTVYNCTRHWSKKTKRTVYNYKRLSSHLVENNITKRTAYTYKRLSSNLVENNITEDKQSITVSDFGREKQRGQCITISSCLIIWSRTISQRGRTVLTVSDCLVIWSRKRTNSL
jgi:hypothetical protein